MSEPKKSAHGPKVDTAIQNLGKAAEQLVRFTATDSRWQRFDRMVEQLIKAVKSER